MATRILVVDDSPTLRSVVSSILERSGYETVVAIDGQDALETLGKLDKTDRKPDLVLVDFVMPRMNGFQLCRALQGDPELAKLPVVMMSAKGDRIRDQFVQQTGALDAITKPFEPEALVAVIENALRRLNTHHASATRLPDFENDVSTSAGDALAVERETQRTHVHQVISQKLAGVVVQTLAEHPGIADAADFEDVLATRLSNEATVELMTSVAALHSGARDGSKTSVLAGDLGVVPIGAILQLLQGENQSGVLVCRQLDTEVRATFRAGVIDLVQSVGTSDEFRIGRFFVEEGLLTPAEIDAVLHQARTAPPMDPSAAESEGPLSAVQAKESFTPRQPTPLGMALLAAGKITEADLRSALARQSSELLYEVLRWPAGRFELRKETPSPLAESARLGMPVASVVMEGFRRVDEWRVLESSLGSFDSVLARDGEALGTFDVASLPAREKTVLDATDGERSVREIVSASRLSSFDACRILVQLLEARVLRRRPG